ncbi:MAG: esterase family protein [Sphingobacteriales bacterium]|nr:MAG: esterase family protein [Sphingobacteriales bacterium]
MTKLFTLFLLFAGLKTFAADVDTVSIYSNAMGRAYKCVVIKPASYKKGKTAYPTVYLLHGLGGKYSDWVTKAPALKEHADRNDVLVVCPDGAINSWYFDSPVDSTMRFETYVSSEIPAYIDDHYRTIRDRSGRAITGLSMGGHGGLFLGYRHAAAFGAAGSMSGALAVEMIKEPFYGVSKRLGDSSNTARYHEYSIFGILDKAPKDTLALILDCGSEDFIVEMSRAAHKRLQELKIPHDYTERPGGHDWKYWNTAVPYQLLFFRNYFDKKK